MHDKLAMQLQTQILEEITKTGAKGVLIDISVLEMVDSFIGRMLSGMAPWLPSWMLRGNCWDATGNCHYTGRVGP